MKTLHSISFVLVFLFGSKINAQFKTGTDLIRHIHTKTRNKPCATLEFKQVTNRFDADSVKSKTIWTEYLKYPDKLRIDIGDTALGNYAIFKNDSAFRFRDHKLMNSSKDENLIMLLLGGMFYRDLQDVYNRMERAGIDLDSISTQSLDGKACYVVGTKGANNSKPQVWFNKKTLLLEKFIENMDGTLVEVRVLERTKACKTDVETKLMIYFNGKKFQEEFYYDIKFNEGIPDSRFEIR